MVRRQRQCLFEDDLYADLCSGSGETLYDKYLHDAAQKSSDDFEMAANIVARDSLKLATECAAVAFVQALDSMYPKYNAPAFLEALL